MEELQAIFSHFRFEIQFPRRLALVLIVIVALLLAAPQAWALAARIGDWVGAWFQFDTPGNESSMSVGGFEAFIPYSPRYLPEGFDSSGLGGLTTADQDRLDLIYSRDEKFVYILQSKGTGVSGLPHGESIEIGGKPGVFVQSFAASSGELQQRIARISIVSTFDYAKTRLLVWYIGEIKIELVSNLPKDEILKIALSLAPAE